MSRINRRSLLAAAMMVAASSAWAQPVPEKPVTVEFFGLASHDWPTVIQKFQADYPNIKIKFTKFGTDEMKQALRVGASSGKMPDLWWNWGGSLASPYNRAGYSTPITPEILATYKIGDVLAPSAIEITKDGPTLYGIPHRINPFTFIYKKPLFEKLNIKVPATLTELEQAAETLKANNVIPFSNGGKFSWMTMRYFDFFLEHYAGPQGHDDLLDMKTSWNSPPVIKAFTKLKEWVEKGYFPKGFLNTDPATTTSFLYNDQAGIVFETITVETNRIKRENQKVTDYGTFPLPTGHKPLRVPGSPSQLQVNTKAPDDVRKAAMLFATYVARPDVAPMVARAAGFPSATKGVLPGDDLPIQRQWADWTANDIGFYRLTDQGLPQDVVAAYFEAQDAMILGAITPEEAAEQVQEAVDRYKKRAAN